MVVRVPFLEFESEDYRVFLGPWYERLATDRNLGGIFSNYYVPYLGMLLIATLLPLPKLFAIKLISIAFDYLSAWMVSCLVRKCHANPNAGLYAWGLALFLPTGIINSAMWGQCDATYTGFLLCTVYCVMCGKYRLGGIAYGVAFAFKPQAVFLLPVVLGLLFAGILTWRFLWLTLLTYVLLGVPAMLAGRNPWHVVWHWALQTNLHVLSAGAPNIYQFCAKKWDYNYGYAIGICVSLIGAAGVTYAVYRCFVNVKEFCCLITFAVLSTLVIPFVLPGMHERYFYSADVFTLVYSIVFPRYWFIGVGMQICSVCAYTPFLLSVTILPSEMLALVPFTSITFVVWHLCKYMKICAKAPSSRR